jgi:hypothetical protein
MLTEGSARVTWGDSARAGAAITIATASAKTPERSNPRLTIFDPHSKFFALALCGGRHYPFRILAHKPAHSGLNAGVMAPC